ncbi:thioester-containing protein 1 allele S3-like [Uranotaenia lowii]|uniref:thioester-containing protein 1 allele S3-like n=1 Tax=Uranotaenia lowii TaxID=190385 RepID=UPI0024786613|nr:thioester-containing protein 1 allele S3-like [Uranotaenia lowii]
MITKLPNTWVFPFLLISGCLAAVPRTSNHISVIGSRTIFPNADFVVAATNYMSRPVNLEFTLHGQNMLRNITNKISLQGRQAKNVKFTIADLPEDTYALEIKSIPIRNQPYFSFDKSVELLYQNKTNTILIQTDKPVYKPGDKILFRVVVVDRETKPVKNLKYIQVELQSEIGDTIRKWPYGKLNNGVFESEVQIASSPPIGNWTILVTAGNNQAVKMFHVKEYILPKFYVKAYNPKVLLLNDKKIEVAIEATYTFGEPVDGTVEVLLYLKLEDQTYKKPEFSLKRLINGATTVEFTLNEELQLDEDMDYRAVYANITVMERFTNLTVTIDHEIKFYEYPYKVTLVSSEKIIRPGIPYSFEIKIRDILGNANRGRNDFELIMRSGDSEVKLPQKLDGSGNSLITYTPRDLIGSWLVVEVNYEGKSYIVTTINIASSSSQEFIHVNLKPKTSIVVHKKVEFQVTCTVPMTMFSYVIISKGLVVDANAFQNVNVKSKKFYVQLKPQMVPKAKIIVSYIHNDSIIFDDAELIFDNFDNKLTLRPDREKYEPGQEFDLTAFSSHHSYIAFQAIDQSALLLGYDGHDLTKEDLINDLDQYEVKDDYGFNNFGLLGLFMVSNAKEEDTASSRNSLSRLGNVIRNPNSVIQIRTRFMESWLWKNEILDGRTTQKYIRSTVPDTITSWFISGFALSPSLGMGFIDKPVKIMVTKAFYIVANLPYSIKRDETVMVQVTVFNFLGTNRTVDVTLFSKQGEIEFNEREYKNATKRKKTFISHANIGTPVYFFIRAKKIGEIALRIEATTNNDADALEHILRVTPESLEFVKNIVRFIELPKHNKQGPFNITIGIPSDCDEGSAKIMFHLDENILGQAIKNLDALLTLPTGCGEQNMIKFVPNVVILDYLSETQTINEEIKTRAINYLTQGYQNQLKFKRSDGTFSFWSDTNEKGSTFLTAFVAKSFCMAAKYIDIDKNVVKEAFNWLANIQKKDGRFEEIGNMTMKELQVGLQDSRYALTSFVLIAFLENPETKTKHTAVVNKAINFLLSHLENMTDVYDLSMTTYALYLNSHERRREVLNILIDKSEFDYPNTRRYWTKQSVAVEVAGYALLSYIEAELYTDAIAIFRYLNSRRSARGAFDGTQATFVGLKALAKYTSYVFAQKNDYRVRVHHKPDKLHEFHSRGSISFNVHELEIPSHVRDVSVTVEGKGFGVFQFSYQYYRNIKTIKERFKLNATVLSSSTYEVQKLRICVSFKPAKVGELSDMAVVEVFFPSGMLVDINSVKDHSNRIKNKELRFSDTSLVVYYENMGTENNCFHVTSYRRYKVTMLRPAMVKVYDYYNTDRLAIVQYEGKTAELCDICRDEDCKAMSCS